MSNAVRIVTDSACDLPQELLDKHDITVVPLTIRFDDTEFVDRVELDNAQFWEKAAGSSRLPSTAAPSPGAFEQAFRSASDNGAHPVVCVTLSSGLSATHQAAVGGLALVGDDVQVRIVDSLSATVGQGLLCLEAAKVASTGVSIDEVVAHVESSRDRLRVFGALDTLENLRKGGRIGAAGAFFGGLLGVKPIINFTEGKVQPESRQRTRSRALAYLADLAHKEEPVHSVAVSHASAKDLGVFIHELGDLGTQENMFISEIGPVIGTHGGPGVVAIALIKAP